MPSTHEDRTKTSGKVRMTRELSRSIGGKNVLIVEDIVDTGLTCRFVREYLASYRPASLKLAALLHRSVRSRVHIEIDYLAFSIEDVFVVGYGLDHAERYSSIPYIGLLPRRATDTFKPGTPDNRTKLEAAIAGSGEEGTDHADYYTAVHL